MLKEENQRLVNKVDQLTKNQATLSRVKPDVPKASSATNFDILKRLSNLEKHVFGARVAAEDTPVSATRSSGVAPAAAPEEDLEATKRF